MVPAVIKTAYADGQQEALEKFALRLGGGVRMPAPAAPMGNPGAMSFKPATGHMPPPQQPGFLNKAWGTLNRVASNPVGQLGLSLGVPMAASALMSGGSQQQG